MYTPFQHDERFSHWLAEFDFRSDPSIPLRSLLLAGQGFGSWIDRIGEVDDALFRRLVADGSVSEDAFEVYLAQMGGSSDLSRDPSIIAALSSLRQDASASGLVMPERAARQLLIPSLTWPRDRPIILRGSTLETMPAKILVSTTYASIAGQPDAPLPRCVSVDTRTSHPGVGHDPAGLSTALAACLANDRAGSRNEARPRPALGKRVPLAIAAAFATLAIIPAVGLRPAPSAKPARVIAAQTATAAPVRIVPPSAQPGLPVIREQPRVPAAASSVVEAKAPPLVRPVQPPEKLALAVVATSSEDGVKDRRDTVERDTHGNPPMHEVQVKSPAQPTPVALAPVPTPLSKKMSGARAPAIKAAVTRKPKKGTAASRGTEVASAMALPDALKPH